MKSTFLIIGLATSIFLFTKPSKKISNSKKVEKNKTGYEIIVPCKEYKIFDEELSYHYGYESFSTLVKTNKLLEKTMIAYLKQIFGCESKSNEIPYMFELTPILNPTYYTWAYRMIRVGLKAFVDYDSDAADNVDNILTILLNEMSKQGLVIAGLPQKVEGDLIL